MRWRVAVLASLVLAVLGIGGFMLGTFDLSGLFAKADAAPSTATEHSIDPMTGEVRMTIPDKHGAVSLRSGPDVPVTLPRGFSLLPGAKVLRNSVVVRPGGGEDSLVTFASDAPATEVIARTREEATAAGFAITLEVKAGDTLILVAEQAGTKITATATEGTPTSGQIAVRAAKPG